MKTFVNEQTVMQFYINQLDADAISFLKGKDAKKAKIRDLVEKLMAAETMNGKITIACDLWKALFDASLSFIDPNKHGYDRIFNYFDSYVEFEELIFASDSFYRDHTLHCIWVYFLGEYIKKNESFSRLFLDMKQTEMIVEGLYEIVYETESLSKKSKQMLENIKRVIEAQNKLEDAVFCVSAITHDLGYPLKKIEKINKSIKKVLPYFAVNNFDDFSFGFDNIQQEFISNFIDLLSRSFNCNLYNDLYLDEGDIILKVFEKCFTMDKQSIVGINSDAVKELSKEEREAMAKAMELQAFFNPDNGFRNSMLKDFEDYQHGIMSAFVLAKNIEVFGAIHYNRDSKIDLSENARTPAEVLLSITEILKSVSVHTCEDYTISEIESVNFLTFVDELEEFSRISRASQNREYVKEFCESYFDMDEEGWLNITFEFHNDNLDNLDPERAFKGRCKRFLSLFDVTHLSSNLKLRVSCVGKLATDQNTYVLELANHHADILVNGESQNIPKYLKSNQYYTKEEYAEI